MGRPPVAAAKAEATAKLIAAHLDEFQGYADAYLASQGWEKKTETVEKWTQKQEGK